jgi:hypothetical protein
LATLKRLISTAALFAMPPANADHRANRTKSSIIDFEDTILRKNQRAIDKLKCLQPVLDCNLAPTAPPDEQAQWWSYEDPKGKARNKYWVRRLHGKGYNWDSSRQQAMATFVRWQQFCGITRQASFEVTSERVVEYINWWRRCPERQSGKPYDTMSGYLKHLAHLQFQQQAVQLTGTALKEAELPSLFHDHDVQDVLKDLMQIQECMLLR